MKKAVLGTRGSALALWQARHVARRLEQMHPQLCVELRIIKTAGDRIQDRPLRDLGGKALFLKEIEEALVSREIDLAVHSMKDVPERLAQGCTLAAILARADPCDAWVSPHGSWREIPAGSRVGTASLRRQALVRSLRPDLGVETLRGNVDTRLRKLDQGRYDAIVLAAAGLERLGLDGRIAERLDPAVWTPAAGQGAIGVETHRVDTQLTQAVAALHDADTGARVTAERALMGRLEGGCHVPLGAYAEKDGSFLELAGLVVDTAGRDSIRVVKRGPAAAAEALGFEVAEMLLSRGAARIIDDCKRRQN